MYASHTQEESVTKRTLLSLAVVLAASPVLAEEAEISVGDSIFAVITHKAGIASGVAHNHMVAAAGYRAKLSFAESAPLDASFELELASEKLEVDRWDVAQAWYPRLEELGLLDEPFSEISEKDRGKIRKAMLSKGQLDAAAFPKITARVTSVQEASRTYGGTDFPYAAQLELTIRGKTVSKPVAARYQMADGRLTVEAVGAFSFTDFGIKPYSALLGAIRNQDRFHAYVNLKGSLP